jgi:hypothetical protein
MDNLSVQVLSAAEGQNFASFPVCFAIPAVIHITEIINGKYTINEGENGA